MLNIGNNHLSALDPLLVKKQRRLLLALSLLLLVAGLVLFVQSFCVWRGAQRGDGDLLAAERDRHDRRHDC